MQRKPGRARRQEKTLRVWTYDETRAASPYIASILRSIRERRLEAVRQHRAVDELAKAPGRPDRHAILALESARAEAERADEGLNEALHELLAMDVYCVDPVQGQGLVPFVQDDQLAWFVFDLFDADPLRFWRFHTDSLETRRPIAQIVEQPGRTMIA